MVYHSVLNSTNSLMSYRTMALHRFVLRQCLLPAATTLVRKTSQHQHRPVSVMVVLTASAASTSLQQQSTAHASLSTLAEPLDKTPLGTTATSTSASTASSSTSSSASSSSLSSRQLHHTTTSEHASPLVAQDIYFNEHVKEGLGAMRRQHATQAVAAANAMQQPNDDDDDDDDDYNADDSSNASLQEEEEDRKAMQILERSGHRHAATLTLIGYKGGIGDDQINQDRAVVISPFCRFERQQQHQYHQQHQQRCTTSTIDATQESCLLGVFDGHGPLGELVSDYSVSELPRLLARKLQAMEGRRATAYNPSDTEKDDDMMIKQILIDSFVEIDKRAPAEKSGGCTASVILQLGNKLYVANAGDSRSFIVCYRKRTKVASIVYMSREDKPHLPDEKARLEKMGGIVAMPTIHGATSRVYYTNPKNGFVSGLAMSRSIGDRLAGALGVIPDPLVDVLDIPTLVDDTRHNRLPTPSFVVVNGYLAQNCNDDDDDDVNAANEDDVHIFAVSATDGLMDYLRQETIAATLAHSLFEEEGPHLLTACEALIKGAAAGWHTVHRGRYRDDIAIAVSRIRIPPSSSSSSSITSGSGQC